MVGAERELVRLLPDVESFERMHATNLCDIGATSDIIPLQRVPIFRGKRRACATQSVVEIERQVRRRSGRHGFEQLRAVLLGIVHAE